jgi:hypothetical protein
MQALFECENELCEGGGGTYDIPRLEDEDETGFPPDWPICPNCFEPMCLEEIDIPDPVWIRSLVDEVLDTHGQPGIVELILQARRHKEVYEDECKGRTAGERGTEAEDPEAPRRPLPGAVNDTPPDRTESKQTVFINPEALPIPDFLRDEPTSGFTGMFGMMSMVLATLALDAGGIYLTFL